MRESKAVQETQRLDFQVAHHTEIRKVRKKLFCELHAENPALKLGEEKTFW
jgi:hypothetical protein